MSWKFWKRPVKTDISAEPKKENYSVVITPIEPEIITKTVKCYPTIKPLDLTKVKWVPSPNKSDRSGDIKYIVLHHSGPGTFSGLVKWLCNPQAKASAHYVLGSNAQLNQLVNSKRKAWHSGKSYWDGLTDINKYSIGIEIQNIGVLEKVGDEFFYEYGRKMVKYKGKTKPKWGEITLPDGKEIVGYYVPYPEKQIKKLVTLCKGIIKKYPAITRSNILTHYNISPGRKNDPFAIDLEYIKDMIFNG